MIKRNHVALIVDTMDGVYQSNITKSLIDCANNKGINLLIMSGMSIASYKNLSSYHNAIFHLLNPQQIEGVILILSSMQMYAGASGVQNLADLYPVPKVSISIEIAGAKSIITDNHSNMYLITKHMIEHHPNKSIGFVSGPLRNTEAKDRYQGFLDCLSDFHLDFDTRNFYEGTFINSSGRDAINGLLARNSVLPQMIIFSNDEMALGGLERLKELGYAVPNEVAISGYDDVDITRTVSPSLTTLRQPYYEMSQLAIEHMIDLLNHREVIETTHVLGIPKIRESCGCSEIPSLFNTLSTAYTSLEQLLFDYILPPPWLAEQLELEIAHLVTLFYKDIQEQRPTSEFLHAFNRWTFSIIHEHSLNCNWYTLISNMRLFVFNQLSNTDQITYTETLFMQMIQISGVQLTKKEAATHFIFKELYVNSREIISNLNSVKTIGELKETIVKAVDYYGISEYFLCLYEHAFVVAEDTHLELPAITHLYASRNMHTSQESIPFPTALMLPQDLLYSEHSRHLVFLSLFSEDTQYGYLVFSMDGLSALVYETLRGEISHALKNIYLHEAKSKTEAQLAEVMAQLEASNQKLYEISNQDALTGLYNRRGFYTQIDTLKNTPQFQNQLFTLLFGDLDGLKVINDLYGHSAGNEALYAIAQILKNACEEDAIVARMSGDEFAILLYQDLSEDAAKQLLQKIESQINTFNQTSPLPYNLSISIGYAISNIETVDTIDELISIADNRLYEIKKVKVKHIVKP